MISFKKILMTYKTIEHEAIIHMLKYVFNNKTKKCKNKNNKIQVY